MEARSRMDSFEFLKRRCQNTPLGTWSNAVEKNLFFVLAALVEVGVGSSTNEIILFLCSIGSTFVYVFVLALRENSKIQNLYVCTTLESVAPLPSGRHVKALPFVFSRGNCCLVYSRAAMRI